MPTLLEILIPTGLLAVVAKPIANWRNLRRQVIFQLHKDGHLISNPGNNSISERTVLYDRLRELAATAKALQSTLGFRLFQHIRLGVPSRPFVEEMVRKLFRIGNCLRNQYSGAIINEDRDWILDNFKK